MYAAAGRTTCFDVGGSSFISFPCGSKIFKIGFGGSNWPLFAKAA
jgi:hypothetical protein